MAKKSQPEIIPPEAAGSTELALFPKLNLPSVTGITEEMNKSFGTMYTRIEAGIAELPTDMTVKANREKVASYAYSISRTKTGLDAAAKDVAGDAKQIVDAVNAERSLLKDTLDTLRDRARAKLDAWEAKQKAINDFANAEIFRLRNINADLANVTSDGMAGVLENLVNDQYSVDTWGDRVEELEQERKYAITSLRGLIERTERQEREAAELEQLRREKAEREAAEAARKAEEERAAAEAAETARREAERARIAQEAEEKAKREAAAEVERIERENFERFENERREREAAEQRAKEAEEREARRIEDDKRRAIEQEEQRVEAAARAEEQAKQREEAAKAAERQRIADEAERQRVADQERAADLAHRRKLNAEAVAGLVKACGLSEKDAQAVIIAIYKEQVPHVSISY